MPSAVSTRLLPEVDEIVRELVHPQNGAGRSPEAGSMAGCSTSQDNEPQSSSLPSAKSEATRLGAPSDPHLAYTGITPAGAPRNALDHFLNIVGSSIEAGPGNAISMDAPSSSNQEQEGGQDTVATFERVAIVIGIYKVARYWMDIFAEYPELAAAEQRAQRAQDLEDAEIMLSDLIEDVDQLSPAARQQLYILNTELHNKEVGDRLRKHLDRVAPRQPWQPQDEVGPEYNAVIDWGDAATASVDRSAMLAGASCMRPSKLLTAFASVVVVFLILLVLLRSFGGVHTYPRLIFSPLSTILTFPTVLRM